jgi:hypothetical protein
VILIECREKGLLVDDTAATNIDEHGARLAVRENYEKRRNSQSICVLSL